MPERLRLRSDWLLLAGFCGFLFFFGLGYFGLVGADEPRYAQVAREMLTRHDWITPTLGGAPWLEKPVLYYWQAMAAYAAFGVSDWAARLPSALDATLLVLAAYLFLKRLRPGSETDGALMVASSAAVIGFGHAASTDMPLAAMFCIGLLCWYRWFESGRRLLLAGFYVFMGLAMLAKGPVAPFLAALIIAVFAATMRDWKLLKRTLWLPGILGFCAVALPWYVAVQIRNPEFLKVFILQHNLERFGSNLYHHVQPFWYFVPVAFVGLLPWAVLVVAALASECRKLGRRFEAQRENAYVLFLMLWLVLPIVFFSASHSKLPGYILPALPAGALLVSERIRRKLAAEERPNRWLAVLHAIVAAALLVPALMIQYIVVQHRMPWGRAAEFSSGFALILAVGIAVTLLSGAGFRALRFVTLVPVVLVVAALLRIGSPAVDENLSSRPLAMELSNVDRGKLPVAVFHATRETEYGLHFYRNQAIARYERGEQPVQPHLLVAPLRDRDLIAAQTDGRRVSHLGTYAPQNLDYYWVSAIGEMAHHH